VALQSATNSSACRFRDVGGPPRHDAGRQTAAFRPTAMILVDTSVWIQVFRARRPLDLESVVAFDDIVTCLPIMQEILQGFRDERAFRTARDAMKALAPPMR
jgi:hypothetical protein